MTCETCAAGAIPEANLEVMENVGLRVVGPLTIAIAELAALTEKARPVWVLPSARFAVDYLQAVSTVRPYQIAGAQLDRVRIIVSNVGSGVIWVGSSYSMITGTGSFPLNAGASLTLTTTAPVYVLAVAAGAAVAWVVEESDL